MNILIIGNGGREHALARKAAQSRWQPMFMSRPVMPVPHRNQT